MINFLTLSWLAAALRAHAASPKGPVVVGAPVIDFPDAGKVRVEQLRLDGGTGASYLRLRGLQYAEHPVGQLRWKPPLPFRPPVNSTTVRDATRFGADCIQGQTVLDEYYGIGLSALLKTSESCLFINVWAPEPAKALTRLPVLFWIHGGSFVMGGATLYPGDDVMAVRRDAIYVVPNYRLGAFGFLGGSAVARSSGDGSAGNFAIQDTREALQWVQRNILALAGDPTRVTIFGESSGASMVATHLVMPRSFGLFSSAMMHSGPFDNFTMQTDPEQCFQDLAQYAGCRNIGDDDAVLACLRERPLNSIFGPSLHGVVVWTGENGYWGPVADGVELTASTEMLAARGQIAPVKGVILGTNRDEGRLMMPTDWPVDGAPYTTEAQLHAWIKNYLPETEPGVVDEVLQMYPVEDVLKMYPSHSIKFWGVAAQIYTDAEYFCPTRRSARWLAESKAVSPDQVFVYKLNYAPSFFARENIQWVQKTWCESLGSISLPCPAMFTPIGSGHGADVPLTWGGPNPEKRFDQTDRHLSHKMIDMWQQFANTHAPTNISADGLQWPGFGLANMTLLLQPEPTAVSRLHAERCDFWDKVHRVPYTLRQRKEKRKVAKFSVLV